ELRPPSCDCFGVVALIEEHRRDAPTAARAPELNEGGRAAAAAGDAADHFLDGIESEAAAPFGSGMRGGEGLGCILADTGGREPQGWPCPATAMWVERGFKPLRFRTELDP